MQRHGIDELECDWIVADFVERLVTVQRTSTHTVLAAIAIAAVALSMGTFLMKASRNSTSPVPAQPKESRTGDPSASAQPSGAKPEDWIFGSIEPIVIYRYADIPGIPAYCKNALKLLEHTRDAVAADQGCAVRLDASSVLTLECDLPAAAGCQLRYTGQIWPARNPASAAEFELLGIGWLRNTCRTVSYRVDPATRLQVDQKGGAAMRRIVDACTAAIGAPSQTPPRVTP